MQSAKEDAKQFLRNVIREHADDIKLQRDQFQIILQEVRIKKLKERVEQRKEARRREAEERKKLEQQRLTAEKESFRSSEREVTTPTTATHNSLPAATVLPTQSQTRKFVPSSVARNQGITSQAAPPPASNQQNSRWVASARSQQNVQLSAVSSPLPVIQRAQPPPPQAEPTVTSGEKVKKPYVPPQQRSALAPSNGGGGSWRSKQ